MGDEDLYDTSLETCKRCLDGKPGARVQGLVGLEAVEILGIKHGEGFGEIGRYCCNVWCAIRPLFAPKGFCKELSGPQERSDKKSQLISNLSCLNMIVKEELSERRVCHTDATVAPSWMTDLHPRGCREVVSHLVASYDRQGDTSGLFYTPALKGERASKDTRGIHTELVWQKNLTHKIQYGCLSEEFLSVENRV